MNRKFVFALTVCLLGALLLAGCTKNTVKPRPSPTVTPRATPIVTPAPVVTPIPSVEPISPSAVPSGSDLAKAKRVESEIEKLSEVNGTAALIHGDKAVIAVRFDGAYKGEMTDRIEQMVMAKVKQIDDSLAEIVVSDNTGIFEDVRAVSGRLEAGEKVANFGADFDQLLAKIKPAS